MGYDEADVRWSRWWVLLWTLNVLFLAVYAAYASAGAWFSAFLVTFLLPEMVGLRRHRDGLPPLTYVVRRYVPRWVPTAVTFGAGAFLICEWWGVTGARELEAVGVATMIGWLTNHWDVTYG